MFDHVDAYAGDPILGLNETFQKDARPQKVNLSIGLYFDDEGRLPALPSVLEAERRVAARAGPRPYLPMPGLAAYGRAVQDLVFGLERAAALRHRIATLQTLGASGALKIGGDFLRRYLRRSRVWVSDPTWENHRVVFEGSGFEVRTYPYHDEHTGGLRFDDMMATLRTLPERDIVLLHACCHNPTGTDPSLAQWLEIVDAIKAQGLIAFIDLAYQGFGHSLDDDVAAIQAFVDAGVPTVVANSFSKNLALYGERCGALHVLCATAEERERVHGQLMATVRANYSNPPTHGAATVVELLGDPALRAEWIGELGAMRSRLRGMREALHDTLSARLQSNDWSRYLAQQGMFAYTGLTAAQADALRERHGVYVLRSGRLCVAGLNTRNVGVVADAIVDVWQGRS